MLTYYTYLDYINQLEQGKLMINIRIHDIDLRNINLCNYSNNFYLLFKLQKKIYEASKKCHSSLVHGLQKLLISLSSIKLLAKNIVSKTIEQNNNLKIQYISYLKIKRDNFKEFDKEINKQILCWLLDSEWKPKIESSSFSNRNFLLKISALYKEQYAYQISCLIYQPIIIPKFIQKQYLLKKLQSFSWVNNKISSLLEQEYGINSFYSLDKIIRNIIIRKYNLLILLHEILSTGFEWVIIRQIKACLKSYIVYLEIYITPIDIIYFSKNIAILRRIQLVLKKFLHSLGLHFYFNKINSVNNTINMDNITFYSLLKENIINLKPKPHTEAIKQLTWLVKNTLYSKNKFGKIRAKTNLSLKKNILKINSIVIKWYQYFACIISRFSLWKITLIIDEIIYRWAKKNIKPIK